jgi:hypothetical protein
MTFYHLMYIDWLPHEIWTLLHIRNILVGGTKEAQEASSLTVSFYIPLCFVGSTFCFDAPSHDFSNANIFGLYPHILKSSLHWRKPICKSNCNFERIFGNIKTKTVKPIWEHWQFWGYLFIFFETFETWIGMCLLGISIGISVCCCAPKDTIPTLRA